MFNPKSVANLKPFKKGENGKVPPKPGERITDVLRKLVDTAPEVRRVPKTYKDVICYALIDKATSGDTAAIREMFERLDGKVPQAVTGGDGGPVVIRIVEDGNAK